MVRQSHVSIQFHSSLVNYLTSLVLSFLIWKMGTTIPTSQDCWGKHLISGVTQLSAQVVMTPPYRRGNSGSERGSVQTGTGTSSFGQLCRRWGPGISPGFLEPLHPHLRLLGCSGNRVGKSIIITHNENMLEPSLYIHYLHLLVLFRFQMWV